MIQKTAVKTKTIFKSIVVTHAVLLHNTANNENIKLSTVYLHVLRPRTSIESFQNPGRSSWSIIQQFDPFSPCIEALLYILKE